jgi:hypothetical protein
MQLRGPSNDVALMKALLIERFEFEESDIATLTEEAGGEDLLPTRANIIREFAKLSVLAKEGDQVVILLAGHGSQQPDSKAADPEDFESDGLDEIFLPRDIGEWDGGNNNVKNAIVDDELRALLAAITSKGAAIWVVIDACHSGTMIRDASDEQPRQIAPDVLTPSIVLEAAQKRASQRRSPFVRSPSQSFGVADAGGIVAIYAAQSTEPTIEKSLPPEADKRKHYGLLTYTINQVLSQTQSAMTYRELAQHVHQQYTRWGRSYPTPMIEGTDCDRDVLGLKVWNGRSRSLLGMSELGEWTINAGAISGIRTGSVLAVYPPAGETNGENLVGHVKVISTGPLSSSVVPTSFSNFALVENLPVNGRCEVVRHDYGAMRLRVALTPQLSKADDSARHDALESLTQLSVSEGSLLTFVDDPTNAQWLVHIEDEKAYLVPSNGWLAASSQSTSAPPPTQPWLGPVLIDDNLDDWLQDRLGRIARVQNLLQMAGPDGGITAEDNAINVVAEMVRYDPAKPNQPEPVQWNEGRSVRSGDVVGFRVRNAGREPVDITLLFIDSTYGITAYFPQPGFAGDARLDAGKEFLSRRASVTPSAGLEHMLVIAVRSEPQRAPVDFTCLCQPSIEKAESTRGAQHGLESPLGKLFQNAVFARGGTRGLDRTLVDTHTIRLMSWRVLELK